METVPGVGSAGRPAHGRASERAMTTSVVTHGTSGFGEAQPRRRGCPQRTSPLNERTDPNDIEPLLKNAYSWPVLHYAGRHETIWLGRTVGEATPPGDGAAARRPTISGGRPEGWRRPELGRSVAPGVSPRPADRVTRAADSRPPATIDEGAADTPSAATPARRAGRWAHDGVVDPQAHCHPDLDAVRRPLQPRRCVEAVAAGSGLELAETRTARPPARRSGHRTLEDARVAPDKKTPRDVGPTSCFSMKAAFC